MDVSHPAYSLSLDPSKNKSGAVWHGRIAHAPRENAKYNAWQMDGPPPSGGFEWSGRRVAMAVTELPAFERLAFELYCHDHRRWEETLDAALLASVLSFPYATILLSTTRLAKRATMAN